MKKEIHSKSDSENEVVGYTIVPKVDLDVSRLEIPISVQEIMSKIEQAQLFRAREDINSQLNDILQRVQRVIHRYTFDESMQSERKLSLSEYKKRRLNVLEKIAFCANSADIKEKTLIHILAWLEEWNAILSDMTAIDIDEYHHCTAQMEILPKTFKAIAGNVKMLSGISAYLLEDKKKQEEIRTSRKTLWKYWKERVIKRPATAHALTPNQMISDEFATNTKVSEIQGMLQELIDTTMFDKLENNAINYIASTIANLSKALSLLNNEVKVINLYPNMYISEASEKEISLQVIQELSEENEMLQQKLQYAEEKCEQLIKYKASPTSTLKVLSEFSPQSSMGFSMTDEEKSMDNILTKEFENSMGGAQRKGIQDSVFKWDSAISHTAQAEVTADLIEQQSPLPETAPQIPSKDITEDKISLKKGDIYQKGWTDEYQSQKREITEAPYELETSTSETKVDYDLELQVEQKTSQEIQPLSIDKSKSFSEPKSQRDLSNFPSTDTKSQGGKSRTSKWERLRKHKPAYVIEKSQVISGHKKKSTTELIDKESKLVMSFQAESFGSIQLDKSSEKVKIKGKEDQISSEITTSKEGKTEEKDTSVFTKKVTSVFTKKVKSHELAKSQFKINKKTSESTTARGSPDGKREQDNLDEFHNAIMSFLKEKIDNPGTPLDKRTVPEEKLLLKKAEVEKLGIIKAKMEEYFQTVTRAVAKILRKYKDIKKAGQTREKQMKQKRVSFVPGLDLQRPISANSEISSLLSSESMDTVIQNLSQEILTEIEEERVAPVVAIAGKDHKEEEKQRQEEYVQGESFDMNLKHQLQEERNLWKMSYERINKDLKKEKKWLQMKERKQEQQKQHQWQEEVWKQLQKQTEQDEKQKGMGKEEQQKQKQQHLEAWRQKMKEQGVSLEKEKGQQMEQIQKEVKHMELESSWKEEEEKQRPKREGEDDESQWHKKAKEQMKIKEEKPEQLENILSYTSITLSPRWKNRWKDAFLLHKRKQFHMNLADEKHSKPVIPPTSTQFSSSGPLSIPGQSPTKSIAVIHEEAQAHGITLSPEQAQALGIILTPQQAQAQGISLTSEQAQRLGFIVTPEEAQELGIAFRSQQLQAQAQGISLTPQQDRGLGAIVTPQQAETQGVTVIPEQAKELGSHHTPEQAQAQEITLTPQQAQALGITLTPHQALAQGITLTHQQAQALGITLTSQQAQALGINLTPQQSWAQGITLTSQQAQAMGITLTPQQALAQGITLTPQQAEALGITVTPKQAQTQGTTVTPQQAQALGITLTPQQAQAQGITLTYPQAQELGITLTPQQAQALGINLSPQKAWAQALTLTPQEAQALGITLTLQQALAQGISLTPQEAQTLGITVTPQQAHAQGITVTPQQAQALGITLTPQQAQAQGITLTHQQAQALGITLTPQQAHALGITLTPQQAQAQGITVTPQQTQAQGLTVTPQKARAQGITLTPQQAHALGITLNPQKSWAQGITVTPQQAHALGIIFTPEQAHALGMNVTHQQARAHRISLTHQQAQGIGITLTPLKARAQSITVTPQQAQALGIILTPRQARAQGITVTPEQAQGLGITGTHEQAQVQGLTLNPEQALAQGITLIPEQAQTQGLTVTPQQAWEQGLTVTPQQAWAQEITVTPQQARAQGITVTPQQAWAQGITVTPQQAQTQGMTLTPEQAQGIIVTPRQAQAQGMTLTPEQAQAQAQEITLTPQQAQALGITLTPEQAQAQGIIVTPRQAQSQSMILTPEQAQAQAQGITVTPQQAREQGITVTPQQAQAQGITVTPQQAQAQGITVTPRQAQTQGITITPQQAQGQDITLTHEQFKALMVTLTPKKSQGLRVTLTHEQVQALRAPVILQQEGTLRDHITPIQGQTLKAPATSEQSQVMQIPVTTQRAQILGVPITQGQDGALGVTITPQQTEAQTPALMFTPTPEKVQISGITRINEQAPAVVITPTPEQEQVLGVPLTLDQAQALETPLTAEQAWKLGVSITPEMVQEVSHTLSLKQSKALGVTPTYEQAQSFGTPLTLNQAQALGIPNAWVSAITLRPEQSLGAPTSDKAHVLGSPLTHEQVQPLGAPFTSGQAQPMGITHMSKQSLESRAPPINEQFSQFWVGPSSGHTLEVGIFSIPDKSIKPSAPCMPKLSAILAPSTPKPFQESKTSLLSGQSTTSRTRRSLVSSALIDEKSPVFEVSSTPLQIPGFPFNQAPFVSGKSLGKGSFLGKLLAPQTFPSSKQTLVSKGQFTPVQFLAPEVPPTPGKLPVSRTPPTPGQPLTLDSLLSSRQLLIPRDSLTPQSPLVSKVKRRQPLISGIPPTSSQIPSLWDPLFPGKSLIPGVSSVPGELMESGLSTFSEQPQAFQLPTTCEQSPHLQAPSTLGQLLAPQTLPGQAFPLWISPTPGHPSTVRAPSTPGKPPKDLSLKSKSELVHPSAPNFKVPQTPFTTKKFQISEVSDTSEEIQELQDSFTMEQFRTFQSYLTNYRTPVSQTPYAEEGALPTLMKPKTSLPSLTTQLPKRSQISPSEWDWKSRFPPINKPCVLTSVSGTKELKMTIPPSSFQELEEQRYFVDVKAQRKNLILLNQTRETSGLPSELHTTARNLIIETLHTDTVRLGYLFRKYIAYRLIQRARNNIIKKLQAIQNSGKGYETQNLYIMLNRIDGYQKKMMGVWTEKQKSLEQNRNQCLRKMMFLFSQLQDIYQLNLSQPVPLLIDKKQKPTPTKFIQQPFLELPMKEDRKSDIFKKFRKEDQMEAIWNADQSTSSYPITEKTSIHSLWAQLGGYPPIPMLLQLDVQSTFRKSLASIQSQFNKNPKRL